MELILCSLLVAKRYHAKSQERLLESIMNFDELEKIALTKPRHWFNKTLIEELDKVANVYETEAAKLAETYARIEHRASLYNRNLRKDRILYAASMKEKNKSNDKLNNSMNNSIVVVDPEIIGTEKIVDGHTFIETVNDPLLNIDSSDFNDNGESHLDPYEKQALKRDIASLHQRCVKAIQFKMKNHDIARRLMKAAVLETEDVELNMTAEKELNMLVMTHSLFTTRSVSIIMEDTEKLFAGLFCYGSIDVSKSSLHYKANTQLKDAFDFNFGFRIGITCILFVWAVWNVCFDDSLGKDVWHDPAFKIFRGMGNIVLLFWCTGATVSIWHSVGIDYARILELDPSISGRQLTSYIYKKSCDMTIAYLVCFIVFYKVLRGVFLKSIAPQFAHTFPLLLFVYFIQWFLRKCDPKFKILKYVWRVVLAPFGPKVSFRDAYIGDVMTSIVRVVLDMAFTVCYVFAGVHGWLSSDIGSNNTTGAAIVNSTLFSKWIVPWITAAPLWFRFMQVLSRAYETQQRWPHYGNALKYALALFVTVFGVFNPALHTNHFWILCFFVTTLYQFYWDIFQDWDLLHWDSTAKRFRLRKRLLLRNKAFYSVITALNFIMRFLWTFSLLPENRPGLFHANLQVYMSPFIAAAEILRRHMWGILRLENEHLRIYGNSIYAPETFEDSSASSINTTYHNFGSSAQSDSDSDKFQSLNISAGISVTEENKSVENAPGSHLQYGFGGKKSRSDVDITDRVWRGKGNRNSAFCSNILLECCGIAGVVLIIATIGSV